MVSSGMDSTYWSMLSKNGQPVEVAEISVFTRGVEEQCSDVKLLLNDSLGDV